MWADGLTLDIHRRPHHVVAQILFAASNPVACHITIELDNRALVSSNAIGWVAEFPSGPQCYVRHEMRQRIGK